MLNHYKLFVALACMAVLAVAGCQKKPALEKEIVLARVNAAALTQRNLEKDQLAGYQSTISKQQKIDLVRRWIDDELLYQEALRGRIDLDKNIEYELSQLKRDFLIEKFLEQKLEHQIVISDEEIKSYYGVHVQQFTLDQPTVHLQQILVKTQKEALAIKAKLKKGESFGALAQQYSIDPSADLDGDMGYLTKWDLDPSLAQMCFSLKVGDTSPILKTDSGYHILKILDVRQKGEPQPLALVHEQIVNFLDKKKKKERLSALINDLRTKYAVTVNFAVLDTPECPLTPLTSAGETYSAEMAIHPDTTKQGEDTSHVPY